jgi:hypothetical protein
MLTLIGNCLLDVFGGIAVAALAATAAWHGFKLIRLPELGPWIVLAALIAIPGAARHSFVQMVILFLAIGAVALLGEGRAWRERDRLRRLIRRLGAHPAKGRHPIGTIF